MRLSPSYRDVVSESRGLPSVQYHRQYPKARVKFTIFGVPMVAWRKVLLTPGVDDARLDFETKEVIPVRWGFSRIPRIKRNDKRHLDL